MDLISSIARVYRTICNGVFVGDVLYDERMEMYIYKHILAGHAHPVEAVEGGEPSASYGE